MIQEIALSFTAKWEMGYLWKISLEYMTQAHIGRWPFSEREQYVCTELKHDYIFDLMKA